MCYQGQNHRNAILLIPKTEKVPKEHEFLALLFRNSPKEHALGVHVPTWPFYLEIYKRFREVNFTDAAWFWTRLSSLAEWTFTTHYRAQIPKIYDSFLVF